MSIVLPIYDFATLDKYSICSTKVHWWLSVAVAVSATLLYLNYMPVLYIVALIRFIHCFELSLLFLTLDVFCLCHMWFIIQYILLKTKQKKLIWAFTGVMMMW